MVHSQRSVSFILVLSLCLLGLPSLIASSFPENSPPASRGCTSINERAGWFDRVGWSQECEEWFTDWNKLNNEKKCLMSFFPLGDNEYLVEVTCGCGPYQCSYSYFHLDEGTDPPEIAPLEISQLEMAEGKYKIVPSPMISGLSYFNAKDKTLFINTRHRGMGDCRTECTFVVSEGRLVLHEARSKEECDGVYLESEHLPIVFKAKG